MYISHMRIWVWYNSIMPHFEFISCDDRGFSYYTATWAALRIR